MLLDDHFATIVAGIEQGRATFLNIRRFLTYHLTDNVAELTPFVVWALSGGRFPLALGVLQILALDLGTDTLSAVALGAEPPAPGRPRPAAGLRAAARPHRGPPGLRGARPDRGRHVDGGLPRHLRARRLAAGRLVPGGTIAAAASGAAFMAVVAGQAANAFACRSSSTPAPALGWTTNRLLIPAISIGVAVSLAAVFIGPVAHELDQAPPTLGGWLVVLAARGPARRRHPRGAARGGVRWSIGPVMVRSAERRRRPDLDLALLIAASTGLVIGVVAYLAGAEDVADAAWTVATLAAVGPATVWVAGAAWHRRLGADVVALLALVGTLRGRRAVGRCAHRRDARDREKPRVVGVGAGSPPCAHGAGRAGTSCRPPSRRHARGHRRRRGGARRPALRPAGRGGAVDGILDEARPCSTSRR